MITTQAKMNGLELDVDKNKLLAKIASVTKKLVSASVAPGKASMIFLESIPDLVAGDPGSGKSTIMKMLAASLSQVGKRVIFIDLLDSRSPILGR